MDDVIKVSGHRLGTAEIESALVSHPAVAEAAAIGLPHDVKGQAIHTFVLLRTGFTGTPELSEELRQHVSTHMGPIARPEDVKFVLGSLSTNLTSSGLAIGPIWVPTCWRSSSASSGDAVKPCAAGQRRGWPGP